MCCYAEWPTYHSAVRVLDKRARIGATPQFAYAHRSFLPELERYSCNTLPLALFFRSAHKMAESDFESLT